MIHHVTPTLKSVSLVFSPVTAFLLLIVLLFAAGDSNPSHRQADNKRLSGTFGEQTLPLRAGLAPNEHVTANVENASLAQVIAMYGELTGRTLSASTWKETLNDVSGGYLVKWRVISLPRPGSTLSFHHDGRWRADELKEMMELMIRTNGLVVVADGDKHFQLQPADPR